MVKIHIPFAQSLLVVVLALPACDDSSDSEDTDEVVDESEPARDAGRGASSTDAATSNPLDGLITSILGDGGLSGLDGLFGDAGLSGLGGLFGDAGLSGLGGLFGDGGLSGLGGLFGDGGFPNFGDGGFDPSAFCTQAPQFCPTVDAGAGAAATGASDADGSSPSDAGASVDAGSREDGGS